MKVGHSINIKLAHDIRGIWSRLDRISIQNDIIGKAENPIVSRSISSVVACIRPLVSSNIIPLLGWN